MLGYSSYNVTAQVKTDLGNVTSEVSGMVIVQVPDANQVNTDWSKNAGEYTNNTLTYGINSDGLWTIVANNQVYSSSDISKYSAYTLANPRPFNVVSITGADFNRNGNMDLFGTDNNYGGNAQPMWTSNGSSYAGSSVAVGTSLFWGAAIVYDREGDGYLDVTMGDRYGDSITFLSNNNGVLSPYGLGGGGGFYGTLFSYGEVSGVDVNNDGTVDILRHTNGGGNIYALSVISNTLEGGLAVTQNVANVFYVNIANATTAASMTWGDFNGDGYLDLYIARTTNSTTGGIFYNDKTGSFATNASLVGTNTVEGFLSVAIDWNHDGQKDIIKFSGYSAVQTATLLTNINKGASWGTSTLKSGLVGVTGVSAMDYNWDGAVDLIVSQQNGKIVYIKNDQSIAAGTALHLRIVDSQGINCYYGNTVQLFDSSGKLVATEIINAQSGYGVNDSSALVNFYGLNSNETYSATILKITNGVQSHVSWDGLHGGDGKDAYDLTATAANGVTTATLSGTGYNDTFIAEKGIYTYNGGGGWSSVSGYDQWSTTGGTDIVDFRKATSGVTVNLGVSGAQNTGFNTVTLQNIEGITGSDFNDVIFGNSGDNVLEGRGGNDLFHLASGGHDTLMYKLLTGSDATGGNGQDTVNGFTVGVFETVADADRINLGDLLQGYHPSVNGQYAAQYINGVATIKAGDAIGNYLKVEVLGDNTLIEVDRSGSGQNYATLLTLNGVHTDLATLLANHQISLV